MSKSVEGPIISVVVGTFNRHSFIKLTIASIREELSRCRFRGEIIVIDGGSTDGSLPWLLKQKDVLTIVQHNRGEWQGRPIERRSWGYFMNLGFRCAQGKYICMLSDDCLVVPGAIGNGYQLFEEKLAAGENVGAIAFYWRNWPDQKKYRVGLTLGDKMFVNHGLYLRKALESVEYADEDNYFFYHADGDLCLKMWRDGFVCIDSVESFIEHYAHANIKVREENLEKQKKDWEMYLEKWSGLFYDRSKNNYGSWIEREFDDKYLTFMKFKKIRC